MALKKKKEFRVLKSSQGEGLQSASCSSEEVLRGGVEEFYGIYKIYER
jgi:hypothetical protein